MQSSTVMTPTDRTANWWNPWGALLVLVASIVWVFRDTATSMVEIWWRSDTFQHAFLVIPISIWLVWRRRAELAQMQACPQPWALLLIALACLLWLAGELASVNAASHFGFVAMIVLSVPAVFGWAVARTLTFPLAFLFFAVPFGAFAVPTLQLWTADVTVLALRASGIPVYREGMQFVIPSGNWSVIEACSGIRYQIATLMVGSLFAYLNYRSTTRRVVFICLSVVVPILANWLRAYTIVYISHVTGSTYLMGVGHTTYGWFLFGAVVGLMFFIGAKWAEPDVETTVAQAASQLGSGKRVQSNVHAWGVAAMAIVLLLGTHALPSRLAGESDTQAIALVLPGTPVSVDEIPFTPGWVAPAATAAARLGTVERPIWLWVGFYAGQTGEGKLVSSANQPASRDDKRWTVAARGQLDLQLPGGSVRARTVDLRTDVPMTMVGEQRYRLAYFYWVGGRFEASDARAKLWQAFNMLRGRGNEGAVVIVATQLDADAGPGLQQMMSTIAKSLQQAFSTARLSP
jgi:exosortase A